MSKKKKKKTPEEILPWSLVETWKRTRRKTSQEIIKNMDPEKMELKVEYNPGLIDTYQKFVAEFGNPEVVFYPCCGTDGSASKVFKNVVYMDNFKASVIALQKEWFIAHEWDVTTFELEPKADVLIIMNPQLEADQLTQNVKSKGYVICNNYHLTADELRLDPEFTFIKDLETGKKEFNPVEDIKKAKEETFSHRDSGYFVFQKK